MSYRVEAIPQSIIDQVRSTMKSPGYGHPAHSEVATGTGPCRSCLRPFQVGKEQRILFTYQPFNQSGLPSPGPVFIHAETCGRYEGERVPEALSAIPLVAEVFSEDGRSLGRRVLEPEAPDQGVVKLLRDTGASYAHLRHAEAGCFVARVVPLPAG